MNCFKIFLLGFALLFISGWTALAQEDVILDEITQEIKADEDIDAQELETSEPKILPDSPFYFLKSWGRALQSFFTFDPVGQAELKLKFANEKLLEIRKLVEQNKSRQRIEKAIRNYQNEIEEVKRATEKIRERAEESEGVGKFLDKFIQHSALHQRVLQKLEEQVPPEVFEKIKEAREIHLERFGEVMNKLQENKERLRERLEKNLQEIPGSEFKNFKNLETLKELEEKVPEEAKDAIRRAQESLLLKLKEKVEQMSSETQEGFQEYIEKISGEKERHIEILEKLEIELQKIPEVKEGLIQTRDRILEKVQEKKQERKEEKIGACIQLWDPVCGKDGKTYSNECFAQVAGVEIDYKGVCKEVMKGKTLWWFDDTHHYCQEKQFFGLYMYKGLTTFETKEECEAALRE